MISLKIYDGDDDDNRGDEKAYVVKIPKIPKKTKEESFIDKDKLPHLRVHRRQPGEGHENYTETSDVSILRIHDPKAEVKLQKEKKDLTDYLLLAWIVFAIWFSKLIADFWGCFDNNDDSEFLS